MLVKPKAGVSLVLPGKQSIPIKDVWLYPLGKDLKRGWFGNPRRRVGRIFTKGPKQVIDTQ